eukprot:4349896-Pleurochrysis_carterae.AAC.1
MLDVVERCSQTDVPAGCEWLHVAALSVSRATVRLALRGLQARRRACDSIPTALCGRPYK